MLAVAWSDLVAAGAFVLGVAIGILLTIRVSKLVASFLTEIRRSDENPPEN